MFSTRFRHMNAPFAFAFSRLNRLLTSDEPGEKGGAASRTARFLTVCYSIEGSAAGMLFYTAFVLSKGFGASAMLVALAGMCMPAGLLIAYPVGYFFEGRRKNALFRTSSIIALLAAAGFAFFPAEQGITIPLGPLGSIALPSGSTFIIWMFLYAAGEAVKFPARFAVMQTNFSYRERSRFFGVLYLFFSLMNLIIMFGAGILLDIDKSWYRVLLPGAMLFSATSSFIYSFVPASPLPGKVANPFGLRHLADPIKRLWYMAVREKYFMGFELGYFVYGMGYMFTLAVLPIYYTEKLGARYGQFGITGMILSSALLMSPIAGRWADRSTPTRLASTAFLMNSLFPLLLLLCATPLHGYFAHVWFSLAVVVDVMAWNMGPIFFSAQRDASTYIGINATLTGLRAIVAFTAAGFVMQFTDSFMLVLGIAFLLYITGFIIMYIVHRSCIRASKFASTMSGRFHFTG